MRKTNPTTTPGRKPGSDHSQARRLVALYQVLLRGGAIRLQEAEAVYGVSHRTLQRDLAVLRDTVLGIDDRASPGEPAEYVLPREASPFVVRREQLLALAVGAELISFLSGPNFLTDVRPLLDRLADGLGRTDRERLERLHCKVIVLEPGRKRYRERPDLQQRLSVVLDALLRELPIDLGYLSPGRGSEGKLPRRLRVRPLCLALHRQAVYLVVDVVGGDWPRLPDRILLLLDRVTDATLGPPSEAFEHPAQFDPQAWFRPAFGVVRDRSPAQVILQVDAAFAPYVRERAWHGTERLVPQMDGGLRLELDVGDWREVVDYVLAMGEHVEVIAPEAMRQDLGRRLEAAAARYRRVTYPDALAADTAPTPAAQARQGGDNG